MAKKISKELAKSVERVANVWTKGQTVDYLGCLIEITDKAEPYQFINGNGNVRTKSARYTGIITFPDGTTKTFKNARGGAIARECGIFVAHEHEAKKQAEKNGNVWEIARRYFAENRNK